MKFGEYELTHPTPVHIRSCITQRLMNGMAEGKEAVPLWVKSAIAEGIKDACREHDTANQ